MVPGTCTYNRAHIRDTLIISSNNTNGIPARALQNNINKDCENIITKKPSGATSEEIAHYITLPLERIKPFQAVIVAGTNDISNGYRENYLNEHTVVENTPIALITCNLFDPPNSTETFCLK